ncbi:MAG TPA: metallophosphoesterase [Solirubrobacterales bacterium]|jgi:hypothetical protein|nr:metallophosphoesterase [Solirubrobacterales bacterium]
MKRLATAFAALVALVALAVPLAVAQGKGGPPLDAAKPVTYAVIGDTPYGTAQVENFPNDVAEINSDPQVSLVMHLGDIKNGSSKCTTEYFELIHADFEGFEDPLVFTPGDNEWTDCHRANNGSYWPAGPVENGDPRPARLQVIRELFFSKPGWTMGQNPRQVEDQGGIYVENVTWNQARTQFGDVDVPGSNNDWLPWFEKEPRSDAQIAEVEGRTAADVEWLNHIFDEAESSNAKAVAIGIQADMWDPAITGDPSEYDHFTPIVEALASRSLKFGGPVLLLNGDSHVFKDDHPLADPANPQNLSIYGLEQEVPNLERITVNGSSTPCHEWLKLKISPSSNHPFAYQRMEFANQPGFDPEVCPKG